MTDLAAVRIIVRGRVQGVFFRAFTSDNARKLDLTGYTRNLPGGGAVEVQVEGDRSHLERLISHLSLGPPAARVETVETTWSEYTGNYNDFSIRY